MTCKCTGYVSNHQLSKATGHYFDLQYIRMSQMEGTILGTIMNKDPLQKKKENCLKVQGRNFNMLEVRIIIEVSKITVIEDIL